MRYDALTIDLDDTLWPIAPVIARAEQALADWLAVNAPEAARDYPLPALRALRDRIASDHPELAHDFTAQRLLALRQVLLPFGHDESAVQQAFESFFAERNRVEPYPEALAALERLSCRHRLVAISNGNADLARTGIARYFVGSVSAREHGRAKPAPCIWHAAARRHGFDPARALHVGDHPEQDVVGARRAGLDACWVNRASLPWPDVLAPLPTVTVPNLDALLVWLEG